jgi:hypothetical protein
MKIFKAFLLLISLLCCGHSLSYAQDSTKTAAYPGRAFDKVSLKLALVPGELPITVEYRKKEKVGHEFELGFVYMNVALDFIPPLPQLIDPVWCYGYKVKYGCRFYHDNEKMKKKNKWWYVSPQLMFKQLGVNGRSQTIWGGSIGCDNRLIYNYDETRYVLGGELIFGFTKKGKRNTFEYYIGIGVRNIYSYKKIQSFDSYHNYWAYFDRNHLPEYIEVDNVYPSIQFGYNWSIPVSTKGKK